MRRVSIPIPDDLDERILEMKKSDEYARYSYAKLVRLLLRRGLELKNEPDST